MTIQTDTNRSQPLIKGFFDKKSNTVSYIVQDPNSSSCAVIDSVLDFDYAAGRMTYDSANEIIGYIRNNSLNLEWLIETHVHADHLSAAPYIQRELNAGLVGIGEQIVDVQDVFGKVFNEGTEFERDGSQFDRLFHDNDSYRIGNLEVQVMHTPGHTPACMTHVVGNAAFVGDTLFMPDGGTARADFPGGDARTLYFSIQRVLSLPDDTRLFICHDYGPNGRDIKWETSVGEEKKHNIHVGVGKSVDEFVTLREERDKTLSMPSLIIPALQVNMRAGKLPEADSDGNRYLKVPVNLL